MRKAAVTNRGSVAVSRGLATSIGDNEVFVVGLARTPVAKLGGALSGMTAPQLGAHAISHAIERAGVDKKIIQEAFMGNVVSANVGQAPTRQAVMYAGLDLDTPSTTINKVCASGMKALMMASMSVSSGYRSAMIAGGMESMSNIPYYLPGARTGYRLGNNTVVDGLVNDGLWDVYNNQHMGMCGEACANTFGISREDQDEYAINSYKKAAAAWEAGKFDDEVAPVTIAGKRGRPDTVVSVDEEFTNIKIDKVKSLKAAFKKDGTVTAANASTINDGATAFTVVSGKMVKDLNLTPLFKIRGYGDAARDPVEFTIAPSDAVPRALQHAGLSMSDVDYHEINEAFSVVALANIQLMNLDINKVNVNGGAVALGHPIGSSGARIIGTLYNVLKQNDATIGCASICNGGGGASAIIIERCT
jgi:acetyl-CoA C-acetyltransferase